jgi:hypothetical protein
MKIPDDFHMLTYMENYRQFPELRAAILEAILAELEGTIDDEIKCQKVIMAPHERRGEASYAILEAFDHFGDNTNWDFKDCFLYFFRRCLRKLRPRKDHICIEGLSIEDSNPNPEQLYIVKEQMELIKKFLIKHYDPLTVDQFMRRFADGEKYSDIAEDYGLATSSIVEKMHRVMSRVSKYMKRITNG